MEFPDGYLFSVSLAFGGGIVLSALGSSIVTLSILTVFFEMFHAWKIKGKYNLREINLRLILYVASIAGFIVGRELVLHDIEYRFL